MSQLNVVFLVGTLVASFLFGVWLDPPASLTKKDLLRALESTAGTKESSSSEHKQLLIGFNTNLDAVVHDGPEFLRALSGMDEYATPVDINVVNSAREFGQVFAHHFASSSAGERAVTNDTLWSEILNTLENGNDDNIKVGGNAALMAEAVAKNFPNVDVTLFGMSGVRLAGRLSKKVKLVSGKEGTISVAGQQYPVNHDEVHLILEYPANAKFGSAKSSRANRFIVSRDFSNGAMATIDTLSDDHTSKASALVVAGVHIMEGTLPAKARTERLSHLNKLLTGLPKNLRVHFELGSTSDSEYTKEIIRAVPADSIGLNEQEFFALCFALDACKKEDKVALTSSIPPVAKVQEGLVAIFKKINRLTRVHYHSYAYHIIAQRETALAKWPNPRQAVATGSVIATTRACASSVAQLHGKQLTLSVMSVKLASGQVIELTRDDPIITFSAEGVSFFLAPVVACTAPKQTVGLGDNISATALATQL